MPAVEIGTVLVYQALAKTVDLVVGVAVVHGANVGDATHPIVRPLSDELAGTPAILLVPGSWGLISGGASRIDHTCQGAILVQRTDPGADAVLLMTIFDRLVQVIAEHGKAGSPTAALQSIVLTTGPGLSFSEWPADSDTVYLSWPFELEFRVNPNNLRFLAQ